MTPWQHMPIPIPIPWNGCRRTLRCSAKMAIVQWTRTRDVGRRQSPPPLRELIQTCNAPVAPSSQAFRLVPSEMHDSLRVMNDPRGTNLGEGQETQNLHPARIYSRDDLCIPRSIGPLSEITSRYSQSHFARKHTQPEVIPNESHHFSIGIVVFKRYAEMERNIKKNCNSKFESSF